MRDDVAKAERAQDVRKAAIRWADAGFVQPDTAKQVTALYPDDRNRLGWGFRTLTYVFTIVGCWAVIGIFFLLFSGVLSDQASGLALLVWAAGFSAFTEFLRGAGRRSQGGVETATGHYSIGLAIVGTLLLLDVKSSATVAMFFAASLFFGAAAAWRWGGPLMFFGSAVCGFGLLTQTDQGRLLWIVVSIPIIVAGVRASRRIALPPSHRRGALVVTAVAIVALYAAVHIASVDWSIIERLNAVGSSPSDRSVPQELRTVSVAATALMPLFLILVGWRRREPILIHGGLILLGLSIATIRLYRVVMPIAYALILLGILCLLIAYALRRLLRGGTNGEFHGFTADALLDQSNRTEAIRSLVSMASFTPPAQAEPPAGGFEGQGGGFGGGGASGRF